MSGLYGGGEQALFALPDDGRLHIQLSPYFYDWSLKRVRADLAADRSGVAIVEVATPINAPILLVALDRKSLYLRAIRKTTAASWWGFLDEGCPTTIEGKQVKPIAGSSNYAKLGLPETIKELPPVKLLAALAGFDGRMTIEAARGFVLLLFLVPEALRFDNVMLECVRYLAGGTLHPASLRGTVTNWAKAGPQGKNVLLPHIA